MFHLFFSLLSLIVDILGYLQKIKLNKEKVSQSYIYPSYIQSLLDLFEIKESNCKIIEKPFINKAGITTKYKDLYISCENQDDYFVKVCESQLSKNVLKENIDKKMMIQYSIHKGYLDLCQSSSNNVQSRIGHYALIHKITN